MPARRKGFTLVEIVVATVLIALVAITVRDFFSALSDSQARVVEVTRTLDQAGNQERFLRSLVGALDLSGPDGFSGDSTGAEFVSRCVASLGWQERCVVRLRLVAAPASSQLVVDLPGGPVATLTLAREAEFRYLSSVESGAHWTRSWPSGAFAPRAISIVSPTDTVVLRIGDRG